MDEKKMQDKEDPRLSLHGPTLHSLATRAPPGYAPNNYETWRGALLGFDFSGEVFFAETWRPFLPRGLLIWGAPAGAVVDYALIDTCEQVRAGPSPVPAKFFATGQNFEQLAAQLDAGNEPPVWIHWPKLLPGMRCQVFVRDGRGDRSAVSHTQKYGAALGPAQGIEIVFWGLVLEK